MKCFLCKESPWLGWNLQQGIVELTTYRLCSPSVFVSAATLMLMLMLFRGPLVGCFPSIVTTVANEMQHLCIFFPLASLAVYGLV